MNLPNKLSCLRIGLIPFIVILMYLANHAALNEYWLIGVLLILFAGLLFGVASYTDYLDGHIARKFQIVTNFGKFIDPIADKLLVLATMLVFVEMGLLSAIIPIITLFRELLVTGIRLVALEVGGKVVAANIWGKLKTVTQIVALVACFIYAVLAFALATPTELIALHKHIFMPNFDALIGHYTLLHRLYVGINTLAWISVLVAMWSGFTYWFSNRKLLTKNN